MSSPPPFLFRPLPCYTVNTNDDTGNVESERGLKRGTADEIQRSTGRPGAAGLLPHRLLAGGHRLRLSRGHGDLLAGAVPCGRRGDGGCGHLYAGGAGGLYVLQRAGPPAGGNAAVHPHRHRAHRRGHAGAGRCTPNDLGAVCFWGFLGNFPAAASSSAPRLTTAQQCLHTVQGSPTKSAKSDLRPSARLCPPAWEPPC